MGGTTKYVACYACGGAGMICDFCNGFGCVYESEEYPNDAFTLEEVFPNQGFQEKTCPVCNGTGEMLEEEL